MKNKDSTFDVRSSIDKGLQDAHDSSVEINNMNEQPGAAPVGAHEEEGVLVDGNGKPLKTSNLQLGVYSDFLGNAATSTPSVSSTARVRATKSRTSFMDNEEM